MKLASASAGALNFLLFPDSVLLRISTPPMQGRFFMPAVNYFFPHALILIKLPGLP